MLLFWESSGEGQKLGADFGFKSQQLIFGEIRKYLVKSEGNEMPFRQEETRKWCAHISASGIKILTSDRNPVANNGNDNNNKDIRIFSSSSENLSNRKRDSIIFSE